MHTGRVAGKWVLWGMVTRKGPVAGSGNTGAALGKRYIETPAENPSREDILQQALRARKEKSGFDKRHRKQPAEK